MGHSRRFGSAGLMSALPPKDGLRDLRLNAQIGCLRRTRGWGTGFTGGTPRPRRTRSFLTSPTAGYFPKVPDPFHRSRVRYGTRSTTPANQDTRRIPGPTEKIECRSYRAAGDHGYPSAPLPRNPARPCTASMKGVRGWAIKPNTVTNGHVRTRVLRRGNRATAATHRSKRASNGSCP